MSNPTLERRTVIAREFSGATTEESRAFFQQRLATLALTCGVLSGAFLLVTVGLSLLYWDPRYGRSYLEQPACAFHFASAVEVTVVWLYTRRGQISERTLGMLDAAGVNIASVLLALMGVSMPRGEGDSHALLAVCFILIIRAIVLPSSAARSFWISATCAMLVTLVVGAVGNRLWALEPIADRSNVAVERVVNYALWLAAATAVATFASHIIFGLQQEIRNARQIGQYVLKEKIGEGGMGVVFQATHAMLRRETAVKMLLPGKMAPTALARFEREVRQLARLSHPNTVAIYDYGRTPDGVFYYAMELLEGLDLDRLVSAVGPLPAGRVVKLLTQICASLAEAHGMGLVHRDIKPANVLVGCYGGLYDAVKVLDFGLVKDVGNVGDKASNDPTLTASEGFIGTPLYISPEAIRSPDSVTFASDLYSVAAVGYYLLTATPVVQNSTLVEVCAEHLYRVPDPPSLRVGSPIPGSLERAILKGLEKNPSDRFDSAKAFARALAECDVPIWSEDDAAAWWSSVGNDLMGPKKRLSNQLPE